MSYNALETASPTSLHPQTHFLCHAFILFSRSLQRRQRRRLPGAIACSPKILKILYTICKNNFG